MICVGFHSVAGSSDLDIFCLCSDLAPQDFCDLSVHPNGQPGEFGISMVHPLNLLGFRIHSVAVNYSLQSFFATHSSGDDVAFEMLQKDGESVLPCETTAFTQVDINC